MRGYWQLGSSPRFIALAFASGVPFNGMFLYVLSAPAFLGEHLRLGPTEYFWFFLLNIAGIMAGAWLSGRLAGPDQAAPPDPLRLRAHGCGVDRQRGGELRLDAARAAWALLPIACSRSAGR